jgi:hypothetical protein
MSEASRKCVIKTRVVKDDNTLSAPVTLEPFVHSALYDIPDIRAARKFLMSNQNAEVVAIRFGKRCYTITVITDNHPELEKYAFELDPEASSQTSEETSES